jgi:hypothetical protein
MLIPVRRVRFSAAARREFLAEVVYNKERTGLGARFTAAVKEATARAVAFPLTGSAASKNTRRVFIQFSVCSCLSVNDRRDCRIRRCTPTLADLATGSRVFKIANLEPIGSENPHCLSRDLRLERKRSMRVKFLADMDAKQLTVFMAPLASGDSHLLMGAYLGHREFFGIY